MTAVVLVHGWGLGPDLWDAVAQRLPAPPVRLDLGYFGAPRVDIRPGPVIAVGHSFGCMWLLRHWPEGCAGLLAINGFARFSAAPDFPEGSPRRPLDRMIARFAEAPDVVATAFLERCGGAAPPAPIDQARGAEDLLALRDQDERARCAALAVPVRALCGGRDLVAPPQMCVAALPGARAMVMEGHGHLLPLTAPDTCARAIAELTAEVSS